MGNAERGSLSISTGSSLPASDGVVEDNFLLCKILKCSSEQPAFILNSVSNAGEDKKSAGVWPLRRVGSFGA